MRSRFSLFFYFGALENTTRKGVSSAMLERFSIECRKTKTRVITLANDKGHR